MKTDFNNQINSQSIPIRLSSSAQQGKASSEYCSSSKSEILTSEQQLRSCVKVKAAQGEYTMAIALLDQLIVLRPNNAADYNNRGLMHFRNNQIIEAFCDLSQALAINPNLDSAYNNRANCYAAQGDLAEAIIDYDIALDLNPANLRAWINQGIAYRQLEMYELAVENFNITLIIGDSLQERSYAERGRTYHLQGDWNCAVADYQIALQLLADKPNLASYQQKVQTCLNQLLSPVILNDQ